jgi:hypothetical protein
MSEAENSRPDGIEAPWPPIRTDQDNRLDDIRRIVREELTAFAAVLSLRPDALQALQALGAAVEQLAQAQLSSAKNLADLSRLLVEDGEEEPHHDLEGRPVPPERDQTRSLDRPPRPAPTSLEG